MRTIFSRYLALTVSLFLLCTPAGATASIVCYDCHGSSSLHDYRPMDSPHRDPSTGAFQGNHRTHMGTSASPLSCVKCHPGSDS